MPHVTRPSHPRILRLARFLAILSLALTTALISAGPANAASHSGVLVAKANGSLYTDSLLVSKVGAVGNTLSYGIKIINTGDTLAQFNVKVTDTDSTAPAVLYTGSLVLKPLASSPDGYYTKALAPGASELLTAKVTIPDNAAASYLSRVSLYATDGTELPYQAVYLRSERTVSTGNTSYDVFAKGNNQKFVSGSRAQVANANTISATGNAQFSVKVMNNGTSPSAIHLKVYDFGYCSTLTMTAKQGLSDVTAQVADGTYRTPELKPGGSRTIKVSFKAAGACPGGIGQFAAATWEKPNQAQPNVYLVVTTAY